MDSLQNSTMPLKKNYNQNFLNYSVKWKGKGVPNSLQSQFTLLPKADKNNSKRKVYVNYRMISLMSINKQNSQQKVVNIIQEHNKNITHHDKFSFTSVTQGLFNTSKGQKSHDHCNRYRKWP